MKVLLGDLGTIGLPIDTVSVLIKIADIVHKLPYILSRHPLPNIKKDFLHSSFLSVLILNLVISKNNFILMKSKNN